MRTLLCMFLLLSTCISSRAQPSFLDSTFGTDGIVLTHYGDATTGSEFNAVAIQPDGKILAAGGFVIRYNMDGTLDNTFAVTGIFRAISVVALAIQPDGKIIAEGGSYTLRLNANGTLDNTFGSGGIVTAATGYNAAAVALQADGKIVIAGTAGSVYMYCERLLPDGTPDSSFGTNGIVMGYNSNGASGVALTPDGRIVVASLSFALYFMATCYLPDGTLDTSFNHTGSVVSPIGDSWNYCHAIQAQADGKVILAGSGTFGSQGSNFALIRYNTDGTLDTTYGSAGVVNIDFDNDDDECWALCTGPTGMVVAAGYATVGANTIFALARIGTNGNIDSSFGNNGEITTAIQSNNDRAYGVTLQQDGKVVAAGYSWIGAFPDNYPEFTLARYITPPPASIPQITGNFDYPILYPNPSTGELYTSSNGKNHITKIAAIDMLGKDKDIGAYPPYNEVVVSGLPNGMYFFKITFDDRPPATQKILVQNGL